MRRRSRKPKAGETFRAGNNMCATRQAGIPFSEATSPLMPAQSEMNIKSLRTSLGGIGNRHGYEHRHQLAAVLLFEDVRKLV